MHEASLPCPGLPTIGVAQVRLVGCLVFVGFFGGHKLGDQTGNFLKKNRYTPWNLEDVLGNSQKKTGTSPGNLRLRPYKYAIPGKETIYSLPIFNVQGRAVNIFGDVDLHWLRANMGSFPNWPTLSSAIRWQIVDHVLHLNKQLTTHPWNPKKVIAKTGNVIAKTGNDQFPTSDCSNSCNAVPVL